MFPLRLNWTDEWDGAYSPRRLLPHLAGLLFEGGRSTLRAVSDTAQIRYQYIITYNKITLYDVIV